jgi:hypothetical protein
MSLASACSTRSASLRLRVPSRDCNHDSEEILTEPAHLVGDGEQAGWKHDTE